jgi:hypothetical protein
MVLVLGAMVGRLRRMALMKVADAAAPPDMSSLIRESFERQPFVRDAANPEQFILDNYGRFGGRAGAFAKAYRLTKARLGDQVNGIAGSTAAGRARMQSWPSGLSYREVYCLDHFNNQFELITEAQAARCGPEMARMWRLRPTLPDELPSDLDIPVWIVGADREYGLDNLAEEIFNETGVLVQYPIAREGE